MNRRRQTLKPLENQGFFRLSLLYRNGTLVSPLLYCDAGFYSRTSHEVRPRKIDVCDRDASISTHAPLARRDKITDFKNPLTAGFLLTRLSRGATFVTYSIFFRYCDFYSRASREARRKRHHGNRKYRHFYSRASREARLAARPVVQQLLRISTHAPLARRDYTVSLPVSDCPDFYSRASREARHR